MTKEIKTKAEYDNKLARVYELMQTNIKEGSADSDELEALSLLIKNYEDAHQYFPVTNSALNTF